ncbi:MAG: T9SS type A sorting domain-containing protein [Bacteroidota bacterium]
MRKQLYLAVLIVVFYQFASAGQAKADNTPFVLSSITKAAAPGQFPITYPNPCAESSMLYIKSDKVEHLQVELFDSRGHLVSEIYNDKTEEGVIYQFEVSAKNLDDGIYYYTIRSGSENIRKTLEVKR